MGGYPEIWDFSDYSHTGNMRILDDLQFYLFLFTVMPQSQKTHDWMVLKAYNSMHDVLYLDWPQLFAQTDSFVYSYKNCQGGKVLTSLCLHCIFGRVQQNVPEQTSLQQHSRP